MWLSSRLERYGLPATPETVTIRVGDPRAEVAKAAAQEGSLVLLGCQRHTLAARVFLGSVAGEVVRAARTPVLLIPASEEA